MIGTLVIGVAVIAVTTVLSVLVAGLLSLALTGGDVAQLAELIRFARVAFKRRR